MKELKLTDAELRAPAAPETEVFMALMRHATLSEKLHVMLAAPARVEREGVLREFYFSSFEQEEPFSPPAQVLVVCEWSYLTWGSAATPAEGLSWLHLEWIDLHRGDYFASVIAYLRGQLDKLELTKRQRREARAAFLEAVACEKAFWEMARNGDGGGEL